MREFCWHRRRNTGTHTSSSQATFSMPPCRTSAPSFPLRPNVLFLAITCFLLLFVASRPVPADESGIATAARRERTVLFSESFEDGDFASRGWYDNIQGPVVPGGKSGKCLQWEWQRGATVPANGGAMRMRFPATDTLYVSFYVKFQKGWMGSQQPFHPHLLHLLSDLDDANPYSPLANNYLDTYIEALSDTGPPYLIHPLVAIQDEKRVNTSHGPPPNDLATITEDRSVAHCNSPVSSGATGTCYRDKPYYSANTWKAGTSSISTDAWHHLEVYFKMNSIRGGKGASDGVLQEWVDGVQVMSHSNVLYRTGQDPTKKWAQFVMAPFIGTGAPVHQIMWIDELVVATGRQVSPNRGPGKVRRK